MLGLSRLLARHASYLLGKRSSCWICASSKLVWTRGQALSRGLTPPAYAASSTSAAGVTAHVGTSHVGSFLPDLQLVQQSVTLELQQQQQQLLLARNSHAGLQQHVQQQLLLRFLGRSSAQPGHPPAAAVHVKGCSLPFPLHQLTRAPSLPLSLPSPLAAAAEAEAQAAEAAAGRRQLTTSSLSAPAAAADTVGLDEETSAADLSIRRTAWGRTAAFADLEQSLAAAGVPEAVVKAIRSQAPSWPSLSKDAEGLLHRIDKLAALLASREAAYNMLLTNPQVLTRPPAALKQQLVNLAVWLRIPLAQLPTSPPAPPAAADTVAGVQLAGPDLAACQELMQLVNRRPGVLFLSESAVRHQLTDIQDLLKLPALPKLPSDNTTAPWPHQVPPAGCQVFQQAATEMGLSAEADAMLKLLGSLQLTIEHKQQTDQEQQHQQQLQELQRKYNNALDLWRGYNLAQDSRRQQQQQQQQLEYTSNTQSLSSSSSSSSAAAPAADVSWPRVLVCQEPEWLFVDTQKALPLRLKALQRLLIPDSSSSRKGKGKIASSSSTSSTGRSRVSTYNQDPTTPLQKLLLSAPQLLTVSQGQISGRLKAWRKILLAHFAAVQAQAVAAAAADAADAAITKQQQQIEWDQNMEDVLLLLLARQPQLLLLPAKLLEQRAAETQQRLPDQPLHVLLQLLAAPRLHWAHYSYLQHTQQLFKSATSLKEPDASHFYDVRGAQAVMKDPAEFSRQYPQYPAWQAAAAAVQHASSRTDWRQSWGWKEEFELQLSGSAFETWLQKMEGKWQRLLLLAAGKPWVDLVATNSSSSSSSTGRRGRKHLKSVSLRQVAAAATIPYVPSEQLGPILFDAPQQLLQQLLMKPQSEVDSAISKAAQVWQQLSAAAAAAGGEGGILAWHQQLQQQHVLLPRALIQVGDILPADSDAVWQYVSDSSSSSSSSSGSKKTGRGSRGGSSSSSNRSSWSTYAMSPRLTEGAKAAAAVRHSFWQHVQQPGELPGLLNRLKFLQQVGSPTAAAAAGVSGAETSPGSLHWQQQQQVPYITAIDPRQLWSILAAPEPAFKAQFPAFSVWQRLARLVQDKPAWKEELAAMSGQELLTWLQHANSQWDRLAFLTTGQACQAGWSGGMWQAISMKDAVAATESGFVEMFPAAGFMSWQAVEKLHGASSSSRVNGAEAAAVSGLAGAAAAGAAGAQNLAGKIKKVQPDAAAAAKRAQVLLEYAARYPPWQDELRGWSTEDWAEAARLFTPHKLPRLEYFMQVQADAMDSSAAQSGQQQQQQQQRAVSILSLLADRKSWCGQLLGGMPMFDAWRVVNEAVSMSSVPQWVSEWRGLRGEELRGLLGDVLVEQGPLEGVREAARQQRQGQLLQPVAGDTTAEPAAAASADELQAGDRRAAASADEADTAADVTEKQDQTSTDTRHSSSSSRSRSRRRPAQPSSTDMDGNVSAAHQHAAPSGFRLTPEAYQLHYPGLVELGVTHPRAAAATAAGAGVSLQQGKRPRGSQAAAAAAAAVSRVQKQGSNLPPGLAFAAARLAYFQKAAKDTARVAISKTPDLNLKQLLRAPQQELVQQYPDLDPGLAAARAEGFADAEREVLQMLYPWLGVQAVRPEALAGLSAECRSLLTEQPHLLLQLQQFAATRDLWQSRLQEAEAPELEELLKQMQKPDRVQRLQLMVRAGLQKYNTLRRVLAMSDNEWHTRYPIARRLSELQDAAEGVPAWERQLARQPTGADLVLQITALHAARFRLVWLQQEGLEGKATSALAVLQMSALRFQQKHPEYPGDDAFADSD